MNEQPAKRARKGELLEWLVSRREWSGEACLDWPFWTYPKGYGGITVDGVQRVVSRVMCELAHGLPPSPDMQCAHSCGNRRCVNPGHLRWATVVENHADKIAHGTTNRGERQGSSVLTEKQVIWGRKAVSLGLLTVTEAARVLGVKMPTLYSAIKGRTWIFIERAPEPKQEQLFQAVAK